ncbi:MAG: metallophosphoesterase [Bacteroidales bacterium]
MRTISFIIFYSIVLAIYFLINYYIFIRGWQALPSTSKVRAIYLAAFLFLSLSFVAGRILERFWLGPPANFLVWTGSFWLGAMLYFVLILLLIDITRLLNLAVPVFPSAWLDNIEHTRLVLFKTVTSVVIVIVVIAHLNTWFTKVNRIEIPLEGQNSKMSSVNIALVSDIHLGSLTPNNRVGKLVKKINSLSPDIILVAGDMLDEDVGPVIHRDLGSSIKNLSAPLGVYGITGNHEYIGGISKAAQYLTSHGVNLIRDSVIKINDSFYLAGREDLNIERFSGKKRISVEELLKDTGDDLPVILLDHQPFNLEKSAAAGADLQLSGHTHHGQIWPLNFITRAVYTISRGFGEVDGMKVYVSNGVGTWGPPMRLGSRPEIVLITIRLH